MKLVYYFLIFILLINCSFDNKTGIWKNENKEILNQARNPFSNFKTLSNLEETFNQEIFLDKKTKIYISPPITNLEWKDIFFNKNNNSNNFTYLGTNQMKFISKKISKDNISNYFLIEKEKLITTDSKGNIIILSINENRVFDKFNFYKKKYKKINKKLNLILEQNIIYVSDNLGYLYAYDYLSKKILWAKQYKVPFRSNFKISNDKLITSNQDNDLIFFNKYDGNILKLLPTEGNVVKNEFINNISLSENNLFFLNSFGSLYSLDLEKMELLWFVNLNQTLDLNPSNLFLGSQLVNRNNKIVVSSNQNTYAINSNNGTIINKKNFSSITKPIIYSNYIFYISKNDLLICEDFNSGKILYSYDINKLVANFLNKKKKDITIKTFMIMNSNIYVFLENSYILKFSIEGKLLELYKLPSKIKSFPINIDKSLFYINNKNRLVIIN